MLMLLSWQLVDPDRVLTQRMLELARAEARNLANPPIVPRATPAQSAADVAFPSPATGSVAGESSVSATDSQVASAGGTHRAASGEESIALFPLDQRSGVSGSDPAGPASAEALQASASRSPGGGAALPVDGQRLDSQQIVAQIDQRLGRVWQQLSVAPSPKFGDARRAQQVSLTLTGQPAPQVVGELESLVSQATASLPFARRWADQFVDVWLAGSHLPTDDARVQTLKQHFAEYIYEGRPWNATALELLGGSLSNAVDAADAADARGSELREAAQSLAVTRQGATPTTPPNPIAQAFVGALAGEGNHRLLSHIGTNFLDVDLSCARCHDVDSSSLSAQWSTAAQRAEHLAGQQAMYWSLAAILQGIETRAEGDARVVVDRQAELLASGKPLTAFYDLIDGRLQAAEPRLPDGQAWEAITGASVPRQALAHWLSQSRALDEATVNQVWRMVFGRSLVSRTPVRFKMPTAEMPTAEMPTAEMLAAGTRAAEGTSSESAEAQQRELLEFLSTQYRAHGHDLKQLVGWIVRSDAFRRQPVQPTRAQWLAASQDELRQWQVARASFASGAKPANSAEVHSLESSLALVLQWRERSNAVAGTALAQPAPNLAAAADSSSNAADATPASSSTDAASDLDGLRLAPPTPAEQAFVDRLLASQRLDWRECVAHIVCLTPELLPDDRIYFLADELLRQHKADRRAALLDLLWAVQR